MIKKLTNKKIVLISATVIVVVLILGFTLALWSRNFTQTGTNTITSDCFNIEYSESEATSLINSYPQTDEDGLKNISYDVTIENTCNTVTNYSVVLNELSTNTLSESHVKVAVNDSYKMLNTYESATPSADVDNASSARLLTQGVLGPQQEKTISIKSWMDEITTELEGENKTFGYKITIESTAGANDLLVSKIFATNKYNSVAPTTNAFQYGEPVAQTGVSGATYKEIKTNYTNSISMTTNKYVGDGYTFDNTTGKYTLTGYAKYTSESNILNKYTCDGNNYSNCTTIYKIKELDGTSITKSTKYTQAGSISGSGIFSAQDDDGTSFYLRGEIDNNYVSFANKLWKVIRINGDGTIRLISKDYVGSHKLYSNVGYTYDNSKICTASSPCNGTEGTSGNIKSFLDGWYNSNLSNYDSLITTSLYCNDTTYTESGDTYYFGANARLKDGIPSLECPDTSENYGGVYRLKIGLISADEANMAGARLNGWQGGSILNYLYFGTVLWTISPATSGTNFYEYHVNSSRVSSNINGYGYIYPVINLVSDAKVASGNGTESTPYVIDVN